MRLKRELINFIHTVYIKSNLGYLTNITYYETQFSTNVHNQCSLKYFGILLKARTVKSEETVVSRKQLCKHARC
jgi:hypothetical protein